MSKTIVFCADGTWNGPDAKGDPPSSKLPDGHSPMSADDDLPQLTNVCKLFAWLSGDILPSGTSWGGVEMEKALMGPAGNPVQMAKYIHGVGDSSKLPDRVVGGAFGVGVTARIARGYTYLSRNYLPGDRIVIVGFSRGAYTARALAGLVAAQGLLKPELVDADDDSRFDVAAAAWYRWRHGGDNTVEKLVDLVSEFIEWPQAVARQKTLTDDSFVADAKIAAVAVWDTVGALGIPAYLGSTVVDMFKFCDTSLNANIALGIHAVALDEQRLPFTPTLWKDDPRVSQVLFPGGHCDVGGGYPEHGLSDAPFNWIVGQLQQPAVALRFAAQPPYKIAPNACDKRHCAWVENPAWIVAGLKDRDFGSTGLKIDATVRQRMENCGGKPDDPEDVERDSRSGPPAPYNPGNLPGKSSSSPSRG